MNRPSSRAVAIAGAGIALLLGTFLALFSHRAHGSATFRGTALAPPKAAADFVLTSQDGRPAHLLDPAYPATFLFFGYTHCPDACPLALASLGRAYRLLSAAQAARTRIVFVSVDPARDTPAVLKRYVAGFGHIAAFTGSRAQLARVWQAYGVRVDPASHEIGHGDAIYAIDATQHVVLVYPPETSAADLAADAAKLAG